MKRKTLLVLFVVSCAILLPGCGGHETEPDQNQEAQQPAWLEEYYTGNYEYRQSNIIGEEGDEEENPTIEGKRISSPYKEYAKDIQPGGPMVWSEMYSYEEGDKAVNLVKSVAGYWVRQEVEMGHPYGYGKDLEFTKSGTVDYNNIVCDVYTTEYTEDMAEVMNSFAGTELITEPVTAVVPQEYYVNPDTNQLVCVITDVTDKNHKQSLVVLMANQGLTLEEASERYSDTERFREKTEILSYDESMTIEIPEVDILTAEDLMPTE